MTVETARIGEADYFVSTSKKQANMSSTQPLSKDPAPISVDSKSSPQSVIARAQSGKHETQNENCVSKNNTPSSTKIHLALLPSTFLVHRKSKNENQTQSSPAHNPGEIRPTNFSTLLSDKPSSTIPPEKVAKLHESSIVPITKIVKENVIKLSDQTRQSDEYGAQHETSTGLQADSTVTLDVEGDGSHVENRYQHIEGIARCDSEETGPTTSERKDGEYEKTHGDVQRNTGTNTFPLRAMRNDDSANERVIPVAELKVDGNFENFRNDNNKGDGNRFLEIIESVGNDGENNEKGEDDDEDEDEDEDEDDSGGNGDGNVGVSGAVTGGAAGENGDDNGEGDSDNDNDGHSDDDGDDDGDEGDDDGDGDDDGEGTSDGDGDDDGDGSDDGDDGGDEDDDGDDDGDDEEDDDDDGDDEEDDDDDGDDGDEDVAGAVDDRKADTNGKVPQLAATGQSADETSAGKTMVPSKGQKRPRSNHAFSQTQKRPRLSPIRPTPSATTAKSLPQVVTVAKGDSKLAAREIANASSATNTSTGAARDSIAGSKLARGAATDDETEYVRPRPTQTPSGLRMQVGDAEFVTEDQLSEEKRERLSKKNIKPIEKMTFDDLRTYSRDQLRTYCFVYSAPRGKKVQMEARMARYVSFWNGEQGDFILDKYVPMSQRSFDASELTGDIDTSSKSLDGVQESAGNGAVNAALISDSERGLDSSKIKAPSNSAQGASGDISKSNRSNNPTISNINAAGKVAPNRSGQLPLTTAGVSSSMAPSAIPVDSAPQANTAATGPASTSKQTPVTKGAKPVGSPSPQPLLRGANTSAKQKVHAKHAGAKFKAAYNGAGPAIVNIVENAAAYFENKESPEVLADREESFARYQFNVKLLTEIFDGPVVRKNADVESELNSEQVQSGDGEALLGTGYLSTMERIGRNVVHRDTKSQADEIAKLERRAKELDEEIKAAERINLRLFQRIERAETPEEIEELRCELAANHGITFEPDPPPIKRRKINKALPPINFEDGNFRIVKFDST